MRAEWRLQVLAWQKTEDGSKGHNPPDPAEPPPFIGDEMAKADKADAKAKAFLRRQQQMSRRTTE